MPNYGVQVILNVVFFILIIDETISICNNGQRPSKLTFFLYKHFLWSIATYSAKRAVLGCTNLVCI